MGASAQGGGSGTVHEVGTPSGDDPAAGSKEPDRHVTAHWVEGASDEQREAHFRAERWAHALPLQIDRLHVARIRALESWRKVLEDMNYPDETRRLLMEMDAEAHFAVVAARQLLRALRAFDGDDRLPDGLTNAQVRDVRDALEHWDKAGGSDAAKRLSEQGADAFSHKWNTDGTGVLGDVVPDTVLRQWALDVAAELPRWDPYDGWRT